ncbi:MAG: hypothetical protein U0235_28010 [Polyangiaceae bacterium]
MLGRAGSAPAGRETSGRSKRCFSTCASSPPASGRSRGAEASWGSWRSLLVALHHSHERAARSPSPEMLEPRAEAALELAHEHAAGFQRMTMVGWTSSERAQASKSASSSATIASGCDLTRPLADVLGNLLLEIVDVVDVHVVDLVHVGLDVARDGDVDKEERATAARAHHALHHLVVMT